MNSKKVVLTGFILVALVQLAIPGKMIWNREKILEIGKEFHFQTAPIDPTDPFRGKYIILTYLENSFTVEDQRDWYEGEDIYLILKNNIKGLATIESVTKEKPDEKTDYLKVKLDFISGNIVKELHFTYPFDRFYMEESKAYAAEHLYFEYQNDTTKTTYAVVRIKNGNAVLEDVMIDGVPIGKLVKENRNSVKDNY